MARRRNAALPLVLPSVLNKQDEDEEQYSSTSTENIQKFNNGGLVTPNCHQDMQPNTVYSTVERYKLVVLGDEECGKTSLLNTLVKSPDYEVEDSVTTFDACVTDIKTSQEHVEFTLYEISGMEDYASLRIELYNGADIFLVCFDIGRPETLKNVTKKWTAEITEEFPKVPFLVVGCKNDLRTDSAISTESLNEHDVVEHSESVSRLRAETVSHSVGAACYVECCAKTRWNVDRVFKAAAEAILAKDDPREEQIAKHNSVLRRLSRLTTNEKNHSGLKRGSIFSFVVGSNNV